MDCFRLKKTSISAMIGNHRYQEERMEQKVQRIEYRFGKAGSLAPLIAAAVMIGNIVLPFLVYLLNRFLFF